MPNFKVVELGGQNKGLIVARHPSLENNRVYGIEDTRKGQVVRQTKGYVPLWFIMKEEAEEVRKKMESFSSGEVGLTRRDRDLMDDLER